MIDLIIKPTQACNFRCSFCSSSNISEDKRVLQLDKIYDILLKDEVATIIINGGDPLMMPPHYYLDLLGFIEEHKMNTTLSFTSNLWDFYLHPTKWEKVFRHPLVRVCTSFQYGSGRKLKDGRIFTEDMFREVFNKFDDMFNQKLMFISVMTEENENKIFETVFLAKDLQTICKINPAFMSGRSSSYYPYHKAYKKYLDIIEAGLEEYEFNSKEIKRLYHNEHTCCPYCRDCYRTIRAISPSGLIHSCGAFNDDHTVNCSAGRPTYLLTEYGEKQLMIDNKSLKNECFSCDLFQFCNSCYKRISDIKQCGNVEENCREMKKLLPKFKELLS